MHVQASPREVDTREAYLRLWVHEVHLSCTLLFGLAAYLLDAVSARVWRSLHQHRGSQQVPGYSGWCAAQDLRGVLEGYLYCVITLAAQTSCLTLLVVRSGDGRPRKRGSRPCLR